MYDYYFMMTDRIREDYEERLADATAERRAARIVGQPQGLARLFSFNLGRSLGSARHWLKENSPIGSERRTLAAQNR